jgi:hypothetical protein
MSSIDRIVSEAKALGEMGVGTIAIMPNDTATYREDSFDNMKAFAAKQSGKFAHPGLWDEDGQHPHLLGRRAEPSPDTIVVNGLTEQAPDVL